MGKEKDGGPAFPRKWDEIDHNGNLVEHHNDPGMSLRDHFAGQAMQAIISVMYDVIFKAALIEGTAPTKEKSAELRQACSEGAYLVADEMLAERDK